VRDNGPVSSADRDSTPSSGATLPEPAETARPRRVGLFAVVALTAVALDLLSKTLVVAHFRGHEHEQVRLLGGAIYLIETKNSGAAFSLGTGATIFLTAIALAVVVLILRSASRMRSTGWAVALGLVLGGAVGNLVDRIFREPSVGRGHVVDWISLFSNDGHVWPVFNLADSAIVCGAVLSAVLALRGVDIDGRGGRAPRAGDRE